MVTEDYIKVLRDRYINQMKQNNEILAENKVLKFKLENLEKENKVLWNVLYKDLKI